MLAEKTITWESYLADYAPNFYEWVEGEVIKMSPIHDRHDILNQFFIVLFAAFFDARPIAVIRTAPMTMRLPGLNIAREPDLQIILNENRARIRPTFTDGPADICIEIVSPESVDRDHGTKFAEYSATPNLPGYSEIGEIVKDMLEQG